MVLETSGLVTLMKVQIIENNPNTWQDEAIKKVKCKVQTLLHHEQKKTKSAYLMQQ